MDYQLVASTILLPAAISIIVAIINNHKQKRLEFDYNYREYILEKRKKAYERIEFLISDYDTFDFSLENHYETSLSGIYELQEQVRKIEFSNIWISADMIYTLKFVKVTLKEVDKFYHEHRPATPEELADLKRKTSGAIALMVREYFKDIANLDDVKEFKKKKLVEYEDRNQRLLNNL